MNTLLAAPRSRSVFELAPVQHLSAGVSADSILIGKRLANMRRLLSAPVEQLKSVADKDAPGELTNQLKTKAQSLKGIAGAVSMHLDTDWRRRLFLRLDEICDPEEWEADCALPSEQSFSTFIRMIIYLHPTKRPSIGLAPNGNFLSAWRHGEDRITIESLANDEVRWSLSRTLAGERELAAGRVQIHRVPDVTEAYDPDPLFCNGHRLLA
ncbi:hypothetical protein [Nitrobacter sp.]|uniref:hypothetical protein n=1 Tax=Nitrobacter sp. TaxID=29420 RepID=UPI0029CAB28D|nr:hypothetical protein [Nitrobacter sp.]